MQKLITLLLLSLLILSYSLSSKLTAYSLPEQVLSKLRQEYGNRTEEAVTNYNNLYFEYLRKVSHYEKKIDSERLTFNTFRKRLEKCNMPKCGSVIGKCAAQCWCKGGEECNCYWKCYKCLEELFYDCCSCVLPPEYCPSSRLVCSR